MANKPLILSSGAVTESASPQLTSVKDTNAATLLDFTQRGGGAAVNNLKVSNSAAGNACGVELVGSDADLPFLVIPKGTGAGLLIYEATGQTSANVQVIGSATNVGLNLVSQGSEVVYANNVPVVTTTGTQTQTNKTLTAPVISAHTASAGTAMKLTSGTVMTTPEAGAYEYDGTVFYQTPNAGNRGLSPTYAMCRLDSAYTLTSTTAVQKLFNSSANGALTLPVGTYRFQCLLSLASMSATSGNGAFSLAGTATLGTILMYAIGRDGSVNTVATLDGTLNNTAAFPNPMHTAQTAAGLQTLITGTFEVTVTGTLIPSFALNTAAAAVVAAGSYFECWPVGSTTVATIGNWS